MALVYLYAATGEPKQGESGSQAKSEASPAGTPAVAEPIDVTPAKNADERLFLMQLLDNTYFVNWPNDTSHPDELQKTLGDLRHRIDRHYQDIKSKKLDETIAGLYGDLLSAIDAYSDFLFSIGKIDREASNRVGQETTEAGGRSLLAGGAIAANAHNNGDSGTASIAEGAAVGMITFLWNNYKEGKERDEEKRNAVEASVKTLQNNLSKYQATAQNAALDLAEKYSWKKGEAGFEESTDPPPAGDESPQMLARLESLKERRPRDPFVLAAHAYLSCQDQQREPKRMLDDSKEALVAALLVPKGAIYDEYRASFLYTAGYIADEAAEKEIGGHSWTTANNPTAAYAGRLWEKCLKYEPLDETGKVRESLGLSLMLSGRLKEAGEEASAVAPLRQNNLSFAINSAILTSALDDPDDSFKWVDYAVRNLGFNRIAWAQAYPDLAKMRSAKKEEFEKLVALRASWTIDFGVFNDDLVLTNQSAFSLENVVVACKITSGAHSFTPELKVPRIGAGRSYKWVDAFSIPGSKIDSTSSVSVTSDQNPEAVTLHIGNKE